MTIKQEYQELLRNKLYSQVALRGAFVLIGVVFLQVLLALGYITAFSKPVIADIPVGVVHDSQKSIEQAFQQANISAVKVLYFENRDEAEKQLLDHKVSAIYIPNIQGSTLLLDSAFQPRISQIVTTVLNSFDPLYQKNLRLQLSKSPMQPIASQAATPIQALQISDKTPLRETDPNGMGMFYTCLSFVFGGYLAAVGVNMLRSRKEIMHIDIAGRILSFFIFALLGSIAISYITTNVLNIYPQEKFWQVAGLGAITTWSVALFSTAIISLGGTIGTAVVVIVFVILATTASGGPLPVALTQDGPWHWLENILPTGQTLKALTDVVYYSGSQTIHYLSIYWWYILMSFLILFIVGVKNKSFTVQE